MLNIKKNQELNVSKSNKPNKVENVIDILYWYIDIL